METITETSALAILDESITAVQLFGPGKLDSVVEQIKAKVRAIETDISTDAGRKAIASVAYKIARSKTFIDDQGKDLGEEHRQAIDAINSERKRVRDELDALKVEFRKPLTDWEEAQAAKEAENERRIATMADIAGATFLSLDNLGRALSVLDEAWNHNFELHTQKAAKAHESALVRLANEKKRLVQEAADALERERARLAAEEKARVERDARIAEEARLKAEAEAKRREDAAALAAKQREDELARVAAQEKARLEKQIEDQRLAAEVRERRVAENQRLMEQQAADERAAAIRTAETARIAAVEAERRRQADIQRAEEAKRDAEAREKAERESNAANRKRVHNGIVTSFMQLGYDRSGAIAILRAIAEGKIPNVSVSY